MNSPLFTHKAKIPTFWTDTMDSSPFNGWDYDNYKKCLDLGGKKN